MVARGRGQSGGEKSEGAQKVQISSYKLSHGGVRHSMGTIVNNTGLFESYSGEDAMKTIEITIKDLE